MNVVSYLILLTVLLVVLSVLGILVVTFRSCLKFWCCKELSDSEDESTVSEDGHRNVAFEGQEEVPTVRPRPFNTMEPTECPPSYEEAIRQELFRFQLPVTPAQSSAGECSNHSANDHAALGPLPPTSSPPSSSPQGSPSTIPKHRDSRSRSSTSGSGGVPHLSTINEEEEWPVQVVIDCIGVQAARLLDSCNTTVHLTNGSELTTNSKC